jgi:hypothetical protein
MQLDSIGIMGVETREIKNQQNFQNADSRNLTPPKIKRYTAINAENLLLSVA